MGQLRGSLGQTAANAVVPALVHFASNSRKLAGGGCEDAAEEKSSAIDPVSLVFALVLLCLSGLFSGLNLGLMSAAADDLKVVIEGSNDPNEVRWAKRILPLRSTGNLLLCTLLLGNTLVNALIAILLADMTSGTVGAVATTVLIVIFGEIGPQALCSRYALRIGAASTPIVWLFVVLMFVFAYPVSKLLDFLLGGEVSAVYQRSELVSLIKLNVEDSAHAAQSGLTANDGKLLTGALLYKDKLVKGTMTPMKNVFTLPDDAVLDWHTMEQVLAKGHNRIPIFKTDDQRAYVGVLFLKDLVGIGFERKTSIKVVLDVFDARKRLHYISESDPLGKAFAVIKEHRVNLLLVTKDESASGGKGTPMDCGPPTVVGLLSTEDILEEILQEELMDEDDVLVDSAKSGGRKNNYNNKRYDPATYLRALGAENFTKSNSVRNDPTESKAPQVAPQSAKKGKGKK